MVTFYFDTSALVSIYVTEAFSARARQEATSAGPLPFTPLHGLELSNALRLLHGRGQVSSAELGQLLAQVADDRATGRLFDAPLDLQQVFDHAEDLSRRHAARILCRSLDILHVSSALALAASRFVSADDRQLALAKAVRLRATDIKQRR